MGNVAECFVDFAENRDVDLILIATHGRSGVGRWVRGSVADRILRAASIPVLMVRAASTRRNAGIFNHNHGGSAAGHLLIRV